MKQVYKEEIADESYYTFSCCVEILHQSDPFEQLSFSSKIRNITSTQAHFFILWDQRNLCMHFKQCYLKFKLTKKNYTSLAIRRFNSIKEMMVIYKIQCDDWWNYYVGQSITSFAKRFKEHIPSWAFKLKSDFATNSAENNHNYTSFDNSLDVIQVFNKKCLCLDSFEEFEVLNATKTDWTSSFKFNLIYETAIKLSRVKEGQGHNQHFTDNV